MKNLSKIKKENDSIYFCITLRKNNDIDGGDVRTVQKIIDKMEESGFGVREVKCITDTENTIEALKKEGLRNIEDLKNKDILIRLGANRKISATDIAKSLDYDNISYDDPVNNYIKNLNKLCEHNPQKGQRCDGCKKSDAPCKMSEEQRMTSTKFICDLIIKFERKKKMP